MAKKMTTAQIKAMADEVHAITIAEASAMPGFFGKIIPCHLREVGYYTRLDPATGKKVFYELKE